MLADTILKRIITASQLTPFRGRGGYTNIPRELQSEATGLDKARAEAADYKRFFGFFPGHDVQAAIKNATVLDFGSGYGGRTVEYARFAAEIYGVEPVQAHIEAGRAFAKEKGVANAHFDLCSDFEIPYESNKFDVAITFDVLEHVADPRRSLAELYRVLKPGGTLFAVFPLYRGMFSHHLDYVTLTPGLHLFFSPERIMRVVNELLDTRYQNIVVSRHREVPRSYTNDRDVLPTLNGMGLNDFKQSANMFHIEHLDQVSVFQHFLGENSLAAKIMSPLIKAPPVISEVLTFHVCAVMRPRK